MADQEHAATLAAVAAPGDADRLAGCYGIGRDAVEVVVVAGEEGLDALQDIVYGRKVERILLPDLNILGDDLLVQEMVISGWRERGIDIWVEHAAESDERQLAKAALDELDEYGKIPWIP